MDWIAQKQKIAESVTAAVPPRLSVALSAQGLLVLVDGRPDTEVAAPVSSVVDLGNLLYNLLNSIQDIASVVAGAPWPEQGAEHPVVALAADGLVASYPGTSWRIVVRLDV